MSDTSQNLNTAIYPSDQNLEIDGPEQAQQALRDVGICFSGGGSRALSATLGQLRGLNQPPAPGKSPWIDQVGTISSVSGGCWASLLYIFLPDHISYDNFLNGTAEPSQLRWDGGDNAASLSYLPPNNLGWVPTRLGWEELYEQIEGFRKSGFNDSHQWWRAAIGNLVFKDFDLYEADKDFNPTRYYGWQEFYFDRVIKPSNNNLSAGDFHFARNYWPWLIMNTAMFYPDFAGNEELVPVFSSLQNAGIQAQFPQDGQSGPIVGGGTAQPFAMGSSFVSKDQNGRVNINQQRPFSIADIAGLSSSAFAAEFEKKYLLTDLVPQYEYWPVTDGGSASQVFDFADGGNIENSGLADLLANTKLKKIVVFINSDQAVEYGVDTTWHIQVPATIPPLFGYQPIQGIGDDDGYIPYDGANDPKSPLQKHNQVFKSHDFQALLDGLKAAYNDFENTAMFYQSGLEIQDNEWFNVTGNRKVDVLWVCNNRVNSWERSITDSEIRRALDVRDIPDTLLWNFPYYGTLEQLHLSKQQVNMLAHLSCWNVTAPQNASEWQKIFGS